MPGDVVEVTIEGIGSLTNAVVASSDPDMAATIIGHRPNAVIQGLQPALGSETKREARDLPPAARATNVIRWAAGSFAHRIAHATTFCSAALPTHTRSFTPTVRIVLLLSLVQVSTSSGLPNGQRLLSLIVGR